MHNWKTMDCVRLKNNGLQMSCCQRSLETLYLTDNYRYLGAAECLNATNKDLLVFHEGQLRLNDIQALI